MVEDTFLSAESAINRDIKSFLHAADILLAWNYFCNSIVTYIPYFFLTRSEKIGIFLRKSYNLAEPYSSMEEKRTMPICFTSDQLRLIEEYAKRRGMLNVSQAIEDLITK